MKNIAAKPVYSITPFTLLDYPDKTACIIWFAGCNMRCIYCYNPDIVLGKGKIGFGEALRFIESRKGLLDGVVLSGGECTACRSLIPFIRGIKTTGMDVKIDTNGSNPLVINRLIENGLVNYIALDFKAPPGLFRKITGSKLFARFEMTLDLLIGSGLDFEVRTTWHSTLLTIQDIRSMAEFLRTRGYKGKYYIQNALNDIPMLGEAGRSLPLRTEDLWPDEKGIIIRK